MSERLATGLCVRPVHRGAAKQQHTHKNLASRDSRLLRELNNEAKTGGAVHKVRQQAVKEMKEEVSREATSQEMGDAASAVGAVAPEAPRHRVAADLRRCSAGGSEGPNACRRNGDQP